MSPLRTILASAATAALVSVGAWTALSHGRLWSQEALPQTIPAVTPSLSKLAPGGYRDVVNRVGPSVVTILVEQTGEAGQGERTALGEESPFPEDSPFGQLFRHFFDDASPPQGEKIESLGSGFVIDGHGHIVTNNHVVDKASRISVRFADGHEVKARLIGTDPATDLAVIQTDFTAAKPVPLGDSDQAQVGDAVLAIGNPFGLGETVTAGIISAHGRAIDSGPYVDYLQTDAPINRGNSGGPLFDTTGQVIGVNAAIYSPNGGSVGVGFAIPSNTVRQVADALIHNGRVTRGYLGVVVQSVTPDIAAALGLDSPRGALVADVKAGGPAAGKLKAGDLILAYNGSSLADSRDLPRLVAASKKGQPSKVDFLREGKKQSVAIVVGALEPERAVTRQASAPAATAGRLGATVAALDEDTRQQLRLPLSVAGVVVTSVQADGPAAIAGLAVGDVIEKVGSTPARTAEQLRAALKSVHADTALLLVYRDGSESFVAVPFNRE